MRVAAFLPVAALAFPDKPIRFASAVRKAVADPDVRAKLRQARLDPAGNSPQEFQRYLQAGSSRWHTLVKARGIKVE